MRPCGQCKGCLFGRASQWAVRGVHEMRMWSQRGLGSSFLTLTYAPEHLPVSGSVHRHVAQKLVRDLRYHAGPFRYLICGEYGGERGRPHYHVACFGLDFHEDRRAVRRTPQGLLYSSATLSRAWPHGFATIGELNLKSIAYVARYTVKKVHRQAEGQHFLRADPESGEVQRVESEFALMSRRPGLGGDWFDRFGDSDLAGDFIVADGRKLAVPNYYLNRLPEHDRERIKAARRADARLHADNNTDGRLLTRHELGELRAADFKRTLDEGRA